jgi:hypothetical protein
VDSKRVEIMGGNDTARLPIHIEFDWSVVSLAKKDYSFKVEVGCPRCSMVDYDPATCQKGRTMCALALAVTMDHQTQYTIPEPNSDVDPAVVTASNGPYHCLIHLMLICSVLL